MALGTVTVVEQSQGDGPLFIDRITVVGDTAYGAGGTAGLQALYQAAVGATRTIVAVVPDAENTDDGSGGSGEVIPQYVHASDKLKIIIAGSGAESAQAAQNGVTYKLVVFSK